MATNHQNEDCERLKNDYTALYARSMILLNDATSPTAVANYRTAADVTQVLRETQDIVTQMFKLYLQLTSRLSPSVTENMAQDRSLSTGLLLGCSGASSSSSSMTNNESPLSSMRLSQAKETAPPQDGAVDQFIGNVKMEAMSDTEEEELQQDEDELGEDEDLEPDPDEDEDQKPSLEDCEYTPFGQSGDKEPLDLNIYRKNGNLRMSHIRTQELAKFLQETASWLTAELPATARCSQYHVPIYSGGLTQAQTLDIVIFLFHHKGRGVTMKHILMQIQKKYPQITEKQVAYFMKRYQKCDMDAGKFLTKPTHGLNAAMERLDPQQMEQIKESARIEGEKALKKFLERTANWVTQAVPAVARYARYQRPVHLRGISIAATLDVVQFTVTHMDNGVPLKFILEQIAQKYYGVTRSRLEHYLTRYRSCGRDDKKFLKWSSQRPTLKKKKSSNPQSGHDGGETAHEVQNVSESES